MTKSKRNRTSRERGSHTTEMALAVALFALVAGFGYWTFGSSLANFFADLGGEFENAGSMVPPFGINPLGN